MARLGGDLVAGLMAGNTITIVPIHTAWTSGPWVGSNSLESIHILLWVAWQYAVVFLPAAVVGFVTGAAWLVRIDEGRTSDWIASRTGAAITLTTLVWGVWFYWFDAQSLFMPGPPPV